MSVFLSVGASNHTPNIRQEEDYYATDPIAIDRLLEVERFSDQVWEPACGEGHLSKRLKECGYTVFSSDLINRGYGDAFMNFFDRTEPFPGDIITNPPYKEAERFVRHALTLADNKVAMLLKIQFLESARRRKLFQSYPPRSVFVASSRITCAKNGDFDRAFKAGGGVQCYAWFVWEKGYQGATTLGWIN